MIIPAILGITSIFFTINIFTISTNSITILAIAMSTTILAISVISVAIITYISMRIPVTLQLSLCFH